MSAKKHFLEVEKSVFVQILKDHKSVIETKKSDAFSLKKKEKAWLKITADYNSSALVSQERNVKQLKKLWSNLKQGQRYLLTKERQTTFATGGGSEEPKGSIDSDIAAIVPKLENAPVLLSTNLPETVVRERQQAHLGEFEDPDDDEDSDEEEQLPLEMPLQSEDIFEADYEVKQSPEVVSAGSSSTQVSTAGFTSPKSTSLSPKPSKKRKLETRQRATLESVNVKRVENVIRQENLMFEIKLEHQKKLNQLELQKKAHEVREAKARADLAEARLEDSTRDVRCNVLANSKELKLCFTHEK